MKRPSEILKVKFQTAFDFKPWLQMRIHQVFRREDAVELFFAQQAALQYDFAHAFAGLGADFADQIAVVVADVRIQISDQTDGVENIAFADFAVDRNAFDAFSDRLTAALPKREMVSNIHWAMTGSITFSCN